MVSQARVIVTLATAVVAFATWRLVVAPERVEPLRNNQEVQNLEGILFAKQLVDKAHFTLDDARRLATVFVSTLPEGTRLAILTMAVDPLSLRLYSEATEPGGHGAPLDFRERIRFSSLFSEVPTIMERSARLFYVDGNALLSYREPGLVYREPNSRSARLTEEILLGSSDPRQISIDNHVYRLLHFAYEPYERAVISNVKVGNNVTPTCSDCTRIAEFMKARVQAPTVRVVMRNDSWSDTASFPVMFPFEGDHTGGQYWNYVGTLTTPTDQTFYRAFEMQCYLGKASYPCRVSGSTYAQQAPSE